MHFTRRSFLKQVAGAMAVGATLPAWSGGRAAAQATGYGTQMVTLGATGLKCSKVGIGTGFRGGRPLREKGEHYYLSLLEHTYGTGMRWFDLADSYQSHGYMKTSLKDSVDRGKVLLQTKTGSRTAEGVAADIERFRQELDTDVLDVVLMHNMGNAEWPETLAPCMDVLADAKSKGVIRAHGVSCHDLGALKRAAESEWVDVILARINPAGLHMDGTPEEVIPVLRQACENGKGVIAMKVFGEGKLEDRPDEALRFNLSLDCIHAMTIGFIAHEQVDDALARMDRLAAELDTAA